LFLPGAPAVCQQALCGKSRPRRRTGQASEPGLPPYGTLELSALREIGRNFDVFFGVQNLFDEEYYVGFAPTTIGTPRLVNGGIRVRWSGR